MSTMSNHLGYVPPDSFKNIEYLFHSDTLHSFGIYASGFVQKYRIFISFGHFALITLFKLLF